MCFRSRSALVPLLLVFPLAGCSPEDISSAGPTVENAATTIPSRPSVVTVPITVALTDLQAALENAVPQSEAGSRPNPIGDPVVDDSLTWEFRRAPISVAGQGDKLVASTSIGGVVRVQGSLRLIRGDLGRLLGSLNPTNVPFSAHADLSAEATLTAAPLLNADWSINPRLAGVARVTEASIPIAGVTSLSVRGEVQPKLDEKVAQLVTRLNARLSADDGLRKAAARAWADLCRAHPLDAPPGLGTKLYLLIEPVAAHVAPPRIDARTMTLTIGVTATTRLVDAVATPACVPLPNISPVQAEGLALDVPISLGYPTLSNALSEEARRKPTRTADGAFELAVEKVTLRPAGSEVVVSVDLKASEKRWFGASYAGTVHLRAAPTYDPGTRVLKLSALRLDTGSDASLSRHGATARLIAPLVIALLGAEISHSLANDLDRANLKVRQAIEDLRNRKVSGLAVTRAEAGDVGIDAIEIGRDAMVFRTSAKGALELAAFPAELIK